jgi:hypothetical protein
MRTLRANGFTDDVLVFVQPGDTSMLPYQLGARVISGDSALLITGEEYNKVMFMDLGVSQKNPIFARCKDVCCSDAACASGFVFQPSKFAVRHPEITKLDTLQAFRALLAKEAADFTDRTAEAS